MAQGGWLWEPDDDDRPFRSVRRRSRLKGLTTFLIALVAVAVVAEIVVSVKVPGGVAADHRTPTDPRIQSIADQTTMTPLAAQTFFDAAPAIEDAAQFNARCQMDAGGEGYLLGCYASRTIHIYDVSDPALDGTMQLTGAHELLHAEWASLASSERERLTPLLLAAYDAVKDDPKIAGDVAVELEYHGGSRIDSPEMVNELHSILGTVDPVLDPVLEEHFAQYFTNRAAVVALAVQSTSRVDQLSVRIGELSANVDAIDAQLTQLGADYDARVTDYNAAAQDYNSWAAAHPVASPDEVDERISALNELIDDENAISAQETELSSARDTATTEWNAASAEIDRLEAVLDSGEGG
jgi:uncharacterized small protein (DUF1192 family)